MGQVRHGSYLITTGGEVTIGIDLFRTSLYDYPGRESNARPTA